MHIKFNKLNEFIQCLYISASCALLQIQRKKGKGFKDKL